MARTMIDARLGTPKERARLAPDRRHWREIEAGCHLGYRRGSAGGSWMLRTYRGHGDYEVKAFARADDDQPADGKGTLNFSQASRRAAETHKQRLKQAKATSGPLTVRMAFAGYVEFLKAERKTGKEAEQRLALHVPPRIGDKLVADLVTGDIEGIKRAMVHTDDADPEVERRSKDSANRVLGMIKAALNRAFRDEANAIPSDAAWRRVKPFKDVGRSRQVHLDIPQCQRLMNVCQGQFKKLVTAALLTGARPPHELAALRARDFRADLHQLHVPVSKTGPRDVTLSKEAVVFFSALAAGKAPDDLLLPDDDGGKWQNGRHVRLMRHAVKIARLPKDATIYCLRHTFASQSILLGANVHFLATQMGTSVLMLEQHYGKFFAATRQKLAEESAPRFGIKPQSNVKQLTG